MVWAGLAVVGVTAVVHLPTLTNDFIGFGDDVYVTANPLIASFSSAGLWAILTRPCAGFYQPLTLLSLAFDHWIWGLNPFGYHVTNWMLHLLNTALVFGVCYSLVCIAAQGGSDLARTSAAIAAALFGLHPLQVESVAWIAQRNVLLSAFFCLTSLFLYLRRAENERHAPIGNSKFKIQNSKLAFLFFVFALLSHPLAATLPLVLVLLDVYPLSRLRPWPRRGMPADERTAWLKKLPFLALAAVAALAAIVTLPHDRLFVPRLADHCAYLPLLGPFLLAGIAVGRINQIGDRGWRPSLRALAGMATAMALIACAALTTRQIARWHNAESLWSDHLRLHPDDAFARFRLANFYEAQGRRDKARTEYARAVQIRPAFFEANLRLGTLLLQKGDFEGAADHLRKAVAENSSNTAAHLSLGWALLALDRADEAAEHFRRAAALDPRNPDARAGLGQALAEKGNLEAAVREYRTALKLNPRLADVHERLGFAYLALDRSEPARREFEQTIYLRPRSPDALIELARLDVASTQPLLALGRLSRAARSRPEDPEIYRLKAEIFHNQGAAAMAEGLLRQAIALDPENAETRVQLARFLEEEERYAEALDALTQAWVVLRNAEEPVPESLAEAYRRVSAKLRASEGKE